MKLGIIIKQSRLYPDKESWQAEDPDSYAMARAQNIIDRPECSRHMDPKLRERVTLEDALRDMRFYRSLAQWRSKSTVIYWAAHEKGWLSRAEIVAQLGKLPRKWRFHDTRKIARRYDSINAWKSADRASFEAAARKNWSMHPSFIGHMPAMNVEAANVAALIRQESILIHPKDIAHLEGTRIQEELDAWCRRAERWRLYAIGEGVYLKPQAIDLPPSELPGAVVAALTADLGWKVYPSCEYLAWQMDMPHRPALRPSFESLEHEAQFDLRDAIGLGRERDWLFINKARPYRLVSPDTEEGRILRALTAVPTPELAAMTRRALDNCNGGQLLEIKRLLKYCSPRVAKAVRADLA